MTKLALFAFLFTFSAMAVEPTSPNGAVLGVSPGIYEGEGTLVSRSWTVPNVSFESHRKVGNGVIEASTKAYLLGIEVASAAAKLRIKPVSPGRFDMLDLERNEAKAGEGSCDRSSCSFKATVMGGELTLEETWVANEDGFDVLRGAQTFKGNEADYEGKFQRLRF